MGEEAKAKFEAWAIVEIMGHQRLAGLVSEATIAGAGMLRVDVPAIPAAANLFGDGQPAVPAFTTYVSPSSLYRLTPCSEETARAAVEQFRERPLSCVHLVKYLPPPGTPEDVAEETDPEDEPETDLTALGAKIFHAATMAGRPIR